jgi:hypothetical protein
MNKNLFRNLCFLGLSVGAFSVFAEKNTVSHGEAIKNNSYSPSKALSNFIGNLLGDNTKASFKGASQGWGSTRRNPEHVSITGDVSVSFENKKPGETLFTLKKPVLSGDGKEVKLDIEAVMVHNDDGSAELKVSKENYIKNIERVLPKEIADDIIAKAKALPDDALVTVGSAVAKDGALEMKIELGLPLGLASLAPTIVNTMTVSGDGKTITFKGQKTQRKTTIAEFTDTLVRK